MPSKSPTFLFGLILSLFAPETTEAQTRKMPDPNERFAQVSARAGLAQLVGDLNEKRATQTYGFTFILPLNRFLQIDLSGDIGELRAEQQTLFQSRSQASFIQASAGGAIDWICLLSRRSNRVSIQTSVGVGLIFFEAKAFDQQTGRLQRLTNNEHSYRTRDGVRTRGGPGIRRTHELAVPVGVRAATALSRRVDVFGEYRHTFVRSDKLDATLDNNNGIMAPGTLAFTEGNHYQKNSQDRWVALAVGFTYHFGSRDRLGD